LKNRILLNGAQSRQPETIMPLPVVSSLMMLINQAHLKETIMQLPVVSSLMMQLPVVTPASPRLDENRSTGSKMSGQYPHAVPRTPVHISICDSVPHTPTVGGRLRASFNSPTHPVASTIHEDQEFEEQHELSPTDVSDEDQHAPVRNSNQGASSHHVHEPQTPNTPTDAGYAGHVRHETGVKLDNSGHPLQTLSQEQLARFHAVVQVVTHMMYDLSHEQVGQIRELGESHVQATTFGDPLAVVAQMSFLLRKPLPTVHKSSNQDGPIRHAASMQNIHRGVSDVNASITRQNKRQKLMLCRYTLIDKVQRNREDGKCLSDVETRLFARLADF
jgi:hypothetical protein